MPEVRSAQLAGRWLRPPSFSPARSAGRAVRAMHAMWGVAAAGLLLGCAGPKPVAPPMPDKAQVPHFDYVVEGPKGPLQWARRLDVVQPITLQRAADSGEAACRFHAVLVPYERTWPYVYQRGDTPAARTAGAGEVAGYTVLVYQKHCPDAPMQPMFAMGHASRVVLHRDQAWVMKDRVVLTAEAQATGPVARAPWVPQVITRITAPEHPHAAVKTLLMAVHAPMAQAVPAQADLIAQAVQRVKQECDTELAREALGSITMHIMGAPRKPAELDFCGARYR